MDKMYFVYIIKSEKSGITYTGMATNPKDRLKEHNNGKSKFTKGHTPWKLVHTEGPYDSKTARAREKKLKSSSAKNKILNNFGGSLSD